MKKNTTYIYLLLFIAFYSNSFAQEDDPKLDSLKKIVINNFNQISYYFYNNIDSSKILIDKTRKIMKENNMDFWNQWIEFKQALYFMTLEERDSANFYLHKTIHYSKINSDSTVLNQAYQNLAINFEFEEIIDSAIYYTYNSIELYIEMDKDRNNTRNYQSLYRIYINDKDSTKAIEVLKKGLKLAKEYKSNDLPHLLGDYIEFNISRGNMKVVEKEIPYLSALGDSVQIQNSLFKIRLVEFYYYLELKNYYLAKQKLDELYQIEIEGLENLFNRNRYNASVLYYLAVNDLKKCKNYLDLLNQITLTKEFNSFHLATLEYYSEYYGRLGDYEKMNNYINEIINFIKSNYKKRNIKLEKELEAKHEVLLHKKNLEAQKLETENAIFSTWLTIVVSLLIISLLGFAYYRTRNRKKAIELNLEIETQTKQHFKELLNLKELALKQKTEIEIKNLNLINELNEKLAELNSQKTIDFSQITHNVLSEFELNFVALYPDFYERVDQLGVNFTKTELLVLAFIKLNMNTQDTAEIMSVSYKAIEKHRSNIRKKLDIDKNENLSSAVNRLVLV